MNAAAPPDDAPPCRCSFCQFFLQSAAQILSMRRVGDGELPEEVQEAAMEAIAAAGKDSLGAERVVQWQVGPDLPSSGPPC